MKGIVLAGGAGTRLDPITRVASKQLQPVYDKPMIYYPLATLVESGIRDILLISTPKDTPRFSDLLGDGSQWGIHIQYALQPEPTGIAEAFVIGEEFIADDSVALILGDNLFYGGNEFSSIVETFSAGAVIFGYSVRDPRRYGVAELDEAGNVVSLEEKPAEPKSNLAIPGFYLYDNDVTGYVRSQERSPRGELEITDLNQTYLDHGDLVLHSLGRGVAWLDSGTHDSLLEASNYIATIERRQGLKIACLEEIAFMRGYLSREELTVLVADMPESGYSDYIRNVVLR